MKFICKNKLFQSLGTKKQTLCKIQGRKHQWFFFFFQLAGAKAPLGPPVAPYLCVRPIFRHKRMPLLLPYIYGNWPIRLSFAIVNQGYRVVFPLYSHSLFFATTTKFKDFKALKEDSWRYICSLPKSNTCYEKI